jgi:uncharacterized protein YyaL (SSP411 family)
MAIEDHETAGQTVALLKERKPIGGGPTAFVCEAYTCQKPVQTGPELLEQLH